MRESNYTYPPQNRAVLTVTHLLYDRRALDTTSPIALLNNLTSLTYLTSTSPRIREILTFDGGLERLVDILRQSILPRPPPPLHDLWGLNGPSTARVISHNKALQLRHCLAFQCVVNIGVRGSEEVRTRVVQAGVLDLVAEILENWLFDKGICIYPGGLGSQAAVDAAANSEDFAGADWRRRRSSHRDHERGPTTIRGFAAASMPATIPTALLQPPISSIEERHPLHGHSAPPGIGLGTLGEPQRTLLGRAMFNRATSETDVDMADAEQEEGEITDTTSIGGPEADDNDTSMELDVEDLPQSSTTRGALTATITTPRASQAPLPLTSIAMAMDVPSRPDSRDIDSQTSSAANSLSADEGPIPRAGSDSNLAVTAGNAGPSTRPPALNLVSGIRLPHLGREAVSNQSSPVGTPRRGENAEGRIGGRRDTIVARPVGLVPRNDRRPDSRAESGTSDGGEEMDLPTATVAQGLVAAQAQQRQGRAPVIPSDGENQGPPPNVEIVDTAGGGMGDEADIEAMAAEQARLDLEAGAPPGQPGAVDTPRVVPNEAAPTPRVPANETPADAVEEQAQIIIANGAPRGFHDLNSYVGLSSLLNPDNDRYSDDAILLSLQLLAYLSKYPHVRSAFHHPRRPMHPTFELDVDIMGSPLPERPACSRSPDIFSLVQRFTFKPSLADPEMFKIGAEIQYWAGVIMRNACRKDEVRGGIRQCASMSCGKKETMAREFSKCRRCRKAKYCSKECQSRAWAEGHRFWCNTRTEDGQLREPVDPGGNGHGDGHGEGDEEDGDAGDFTGLGVTREVLMRAIATARAMGRGGQTGNTDTTPDNGRAGGGNTVALQDGFISPIPEDPQLRRVALQQRQQFNLDAPLPIDFNPATPLPSLTDPHYVEAWRNQRRFAHQNRRRIAPRDPPMGELHVPELGLQLHERAPPAQPAGLAMPAATHANEATGGLSRFARLFGRAAAPLERTPPIDQRTAGSAVWRPEAPVNEARGEPSRTMLFGPFAPSLERMTGDAQGQARHAAADQDAQHSSGGVGSRRTMFFRAAPSAGPSSGVTDGMVRATH